MTIKLTRNFEIHDLVCDHCLTANHFASLYNVHSDIAAELAKHCRIYLLNNVSWYEGLDTFYTEWLDNSKMQGRVLDSDLEFAKLFQPTIKTFCKRLMDWVLNAYIDHNERSAKCTYAHELARAIEFRINIKEYYSDFRNLEIGFTDQKINEAFHNLISELKEYDAHDERFDYDEHLLFNFGISFKELFKIESNLIGFHPYIVDKFTIYNFDEKDLNHYVLQALHRSLENYEDLYESNN